MKKKENKEDKVKREENGTELVTRESVCAVCALFSLLALLVLCTRSLIFGDFGTWLHAFLTGLLGYAAYPVMIGGFYASFMAILGKPVFKNKKAGVFVTLTLVSALLIVHTATTWSIQTDYLKTCFYAGEKFPNATVAGWLGGVFSYALSSVTSKVGAIVIFALLTVFFAYLSFISLTKKTVENVEQNNPDKEMPARTEIPAPKAEQRPIQPRPTQEPYAPYAEADAPQRPKVSLSGSFEKRGHTGGYSPFGMHESPRIETPATKESYENQRAYLLGLNPQENYRRNLIFDENSQANRRSGEVDLEQAVAGESYDSYLNEYQNSVNAGEMPRPIKIFTDTTTPSYDSYETAVEPPRPVEPIAPIEPFTQTPSYADEPRESYLDTSFETETETREERSDDYGDLFARSSRDEEPVLDDYSRDGYRDDFGSEPSREDRYISERADEDSVFDRYSLNDEDDSRSGRNLFDEPETEDEEDPYALRSEYEDRGRSFIDDEPETFDRGRDFIEEEPAPTPPPKPRVIRPYVRVPLDDFDCRDVEPMANQEEVERTKENILETLDVYKINDATVASVTFGPTVTRYNVAIPRNIPPKKVVALEQPIAINLHANDVNIRPDYKGGVISIEVPNEERQFVQLGCMLSGDTFVNAKPSSIMFAMGKDVSNHKVYGDISKMIHMLVAGASGSGKSVFLGSLIISLIYKYSPEELRLILIDPKKTEFVLYNNLPHLMINEIISDANKAVQSLTWAIGEMERRYELMRQMSLSGEYVANIDGYNEKVKKEERLPKIVIIIDELADLILAAKKDIEDKIQSLTQKARAAGIHLIVATQRPSIDVITGVIKSNLPTRIAFAVATEVDSRVILDQSGAQKLLGKGDFLYTMQGVNAPIRVQSAFITNEDAQRVVNYIKANNEAYYDEEATSFINNTRSGGGDGSSGDAVEPVYIDALRFVILSGSASISMIQRKCSVGYNKAGKIVEWMEEKRFISSFDGAKARKVLISKEEFERRYGPLS